MAVLWIPIMTHFDFFFHDFLMMMMTNGLTHFMTLIKEKTQESVNETAVARHHQGNLQPLNKVNNAVKIRILMALAG